MGTAVYSYRGPIVARLSTLAGSGRTGVLRVSGEVSGAFYLRQGEVIYAKSGLTPGPARWFAQSSGRIASGDVARSARSASREDGAPGLLVTDVPGPETSGLLEWNLIVREAAVDAALELLSHRSHSSPRLRFRASEPPGDGSVAGISVGALLGEVSRREEITRQMATRLTADTVITRNPGIGAHDVQVSSFQWALLIRVTDGSTPRSLAIELRHSVFATTIEVFRLIDLRLLSAAGGPARSASDGTTRSDERPPARLSFIEAAVR